MSLVLSFVVLAALGVVGWSVLRSPARSAPATQPGFDPDLLRTAERETPIAMTREGGAPRRADGRRGGQVTPPRNPAQE